MNNALDIAGSSALPEGRLRAFVELAKLRVASLVLLATALSFVLALPSSHALTGTLGSLLATLLGTMLVAGGANALNQFMEVGYDSQMNRTSRRPIPSGRLAPGEAFVFGVTISVIGTCWLFVAVNALAATLALVSLISYLCMYTPLKRITPLSVFVGAVPGALPVMIGWAGAVNELTLGAWLLFGIVFFWQLPHFAAICWLFREDYARAGYPVLSVVDFVGTRTDLHVVTHTVGLVFASLLPVIYHMNGLTYAVGAVLLGLAFLGVGVAFVKHKIKERARIHLLASVIYLPCLFVLMIVDKLIGGW